MILKTIWDNTHEDVRMRLLSLSLENDVMDWFIHLPTNSISTFPQLQDIFLGKWGEKKDNIYLLATLNLTKRNENETIKLYLFLDWFLDLISHGASYFDFSIFQRFKII
jgi:hypothetical protein